MAIFMTLGFLEIVKGPTPSAWSLAGMFLAQAGIGAVAGLVGGFAATFAVNRIKLDAAGLYPVLVLGFGRLTFGVAAATGGSGFLATYVAGVVIGNRRLIDRRGILRFHDGLGWLSQILMFVILGLLCVPSRLLENTVAGLVVAATLMFVARPLAVAPITALFGYRLPETVYTSWVGLKGAVPITLATFPLLYVVPHARTIFDVVFFAVVVSAVVQGLSLPHVARCLGLDRPLGDPPKELREPASPSTPPVA